MTNNPVDFEAWSQKLANALARVGKDDFAVTLYDALACLASHCDPIIWFYPAGDKPFALDTRGELSDATDVDQFLKGPYLLDPYYLAGAEHSEEGFYRLADLAPTAFKKSAYYRSYYVRIDMADEAGYIVYYGEHSFANISFGRKDTEAPFSEEELSRLKSVAGIVCHLLRQHIEKLSPQSSAGEEETKGLPQHLQSALTHFGTSLLTEREREVIHLFLRGHSTKTAAEKLGISPETIKLHRKNSYAKLDVASQAELFVLFIDSLSQSGPYPGEDPLVRYMGLES